jgi:isoleucyl-tRNA synthetase
LGAPIIASLGPKPAPELTLSDRSANVQLGTGLASVAFTTVSQPSPTPPYRSVAAKADYPAIERAILAQWAADGSFKASIDQRNDAEPYIFFDGPPFANGLPHYGHLLTGYVKDIIPRYQTMRGRKVDRRFGWDCHGLPAEMEAEKELGVSGRRQIIDYGVNEFNQYCRTSVLRYTNEWRSYVTRQARWVDFDNDYKTMDPSFMESVMWAFSELHRKGLVYQDFRVMPYSWGAQTPLSNFEIRMDDATRPRQDPAIAVAFTLAPQDDETFETRLVAWTTTPWTLPSNLALAVGPEIEYSVLAEADGTRYIMGSDALERYAKQLEGMTVVGTLLGAQLAGRAFTPLFDYFAEAGREAGAFTVYAADFVETGEGTGVVHIAPGFGEDDFQLCRARGMTFTPVPVDDEGRFTSEVTDFAGMNVFDANAEVIKHLKAAGRLVRHDTYDHNYPHCWRTDTPIIYRAMNSWYVEVTKIKDRLLECNNEINWMPSHVQQGAFGKWLENARDWSVSRNRFWGSPIPVWQSDNPEFPRTDVYGSVADLERDFGVAVPDLHRPFIDDLVRPNPDDPSGQSMMRRVPEVFDCWFESGSMPFAQLHYPFSTPREWTKVPQADFIVEYVGQTRGWFYTMHVLSVALFDQPAFRNCICHGIVLDGDGRKLSKKLRNYPDPADVFETIGADALRWYLVSSPILRGLDLKIAADGAGISDVVRLVLNPVWNALHFFTLYANASNVSAQWSTSSTDVLDRYILAKTHSLVTAVQTSLDEYDLAAACAHVTTFLDAFNNWYIRRSRDRFWGGVGEPGDVDAFNTMYVVLSTLSKVIAPLAPMVAEEVHSVLDGTGSIHLTHWPDAALLPADDALVTAMDIVRDVCSTASALRKERGLRQRLPLASLTVAGRGADALDDYRDLIADELNVKSVLLASEIGDRATFVLKPQGKVLGPKLGGGVQQVLAAAKNGAWRDLGNGSVEVTSPSGPVILEPGEFELAVQAPDGRATAALPGNAAVVELDVEITAELHAEGLARDLVRIIQQARKDAGLDVSDRIDLRLQMPPALQIIEPHMAWLWDQVLASSAVDTSCSFATEHTESTVGADHNLAHNAELDGVPFSYSLRAS